MVVAVDVEAVGVVGDPVVVVVVVVDVVEVVDVVIDPPGDLEDVGGTDH